MGVHDIAAILVEWMHANPGAQARIIPCGEGSAVRVEVCIGGECIAFPLASLDHSVCTATLTHDLDDAARHLTGKVSA